VQPHCVPSIDGAVKGPGQEGRAPDQDDNSFVDLDVRRLSRRSPPYLATGSHPCGIHTILVDGVKL
jgi:hypothetical protein